MAIPNSVKDKAKDVISDILGLDFPGGLVKQPPNPPARNTRPQYSIECSMGDTQLSARVDKLTIVNSIMSVYPLFFIEFKIDSKDAIIDKIYGQEILKLHISLTDDKFAILEENEIELVIVDVKLPMETKSADMQPSSQTEDTLKMVGIAKIPFLIMTTPINFIMEPESKGTGSDSASSKFNANAQNISKFSTEFLNNINNISNSLGVTNIGKFNLPQILNATKDISNRLNFGGGKSNTFGNFSSKTNSGNSNSTSGRRTFDLANQIFKKFVPDGKINGLQDNCIEDEMEHVTIPPKTFCGAIRYLDDIYGIFKGPMFNYCRWEDNTYCLWDLTKAINMPEDYTVEFLALGQNSEDVYKKSSTEDGVYFTYSPLNTVNKGNKNVVQKGHSQVFIKKNLHTFFDKIESNVEELSDVSVGDGSNQLVFNEVLKRRKSVYSKSVTGGAKDSQNDGLKTKISNLISSSSSFNFMLKGFNYPITRLNRVGGCIRLNPHVPEYIPYQGKYIVSNSIMCIYKDDNMNFTCECLISCFRQNMEV